MTDSSSSTDYPPSVESASPSKSFYLVCLLMDSNLDRFTCLSVLETLKNILICNAPSGFTVSVLNTFLLIPEKVSLLSRLFRRSGRSKQTRAMSTFSAQFPPTEWFNSKAVHLHCVATQTNSKVYILYLLNRLFKTLCLSTVLLLCDKTVYLPILILPFFRSHCRVKHHTCHTTTMVQKSVTGHRHCRDATSDTCLPSLAWPVPSTTTIHPLGSPVLVPAVYPDQHSAEVLLIRQFWTILGHPNAVAIPS